MHAAGHDHGRVAHAPLTCGKGALSARSIDGDGCSSDIHDYLCQGHYCSHDVRAVLKFFSRFSVKEHATTKATILFAFSTIRQARKEEQNLKNRNLPREFRAHAAGSNFLQLFICNFFMHFSIVLIDERSFQLQL